MNPLRTNPFRIWGYPLSLFPYFPPIALKNPRVGRKILKQFLSNGSAGPCLQRNKFGNQTHITHTISIHRLYSPWKMIGYQKMQPVVQNQKTGCGQQTAGIHHLGDSIEKWEIHPLKIFKKNRIISSREKEQKCSTVEIKLDYLEKTEAFINQRHQRPLKIPNKIGHDRSTIFPPLPPPSAHRPAQAAAGHVGAAWRTARGSCAVPNPRNPMEDVPMIPIYPPTCLNPWTTRLHPSSIHVYFMLDQNHCHHVMFVQVLTIYI